MVVHHVEMDPVGAGGDDGLHLVAETGEVGGKDARGRCESCSCRDGSICSDSRIARMAKPQFTCSTSVAYLPEQSQPQSHV